MNPAPKLNPAPKITGVLETCLYVESIEPSARFYENLFGFERLDGDQRYCALAAGKHSVLILFLRGATRKPVAVAGGVIPPHDGNGPMHFALAIPTEDLAGWEERLSAAGVAVESRVHWHGGCVSIFFRDPDYHLVELATPGLWRNY